jgi:hypothetical protein
MKYKELYQKSKKLNKLFPYIGFRCKKIDLDDLIDFFNKTNYFVQFKPRSIEDMKKLKKRVKESPKSSIHLPKTKFDYKTGEIINKARQFEVLSKTKNRFNIITMHLDWGDADLLLDEKRELKDNQFVQTVINEYVDLVLRGIKANKIIAIENVRFKPHKYSYRECLGSKPENIILMRNRIIQEIKKRTNFSIKELEKRIGYTFDVRHAMSNADLTKKYTVADWFKAFNKDIKIIHISDVVYIDKKRKKLEKGHSAVGDGIINWGSFFKLKKKFCLSHVPMIIEATVERTIKSMDYLLKNTIIRKHAKNSEENKEILPEV